MRYRYVIAPFLVYAPLAIGSLICALHEGTFSQALVPAFIGLGVVGWTLLEYMLHRFVLHVHPQAPAIGNAIGTLHLGHHRDPMDEAKITMPVYGSLPIAGVLLGLLRLMAGSWGVSLLIMAGIIGGYLYYEAVHFRIHRASRRGRVIGFQRTGHVFHHHQDLTRCFGVTTPLWDWAFGTGIVKLQEIH